MAITWLAAQVLLVLWQSGRLSLHRVDRRRDAALPDRHARRCIYEIQYLGMHSNSNPAKTMGNEQCLLQMLHRVTWQQHEELACSLSYKMSASENQY